MKKIIVAFIFMVGLAIPISVVWAQISGPSSAPVNSTQEYTYSNGFVFSPNWGLSQFRGTILSQTQSGTTYKATIKWNSVGSETVVFFDGQMPLGQLNVTITEPPPAAPTANTAPAATTTSTSFVASWNSVATATSYLLDVATNPAVTSNFAPGGYPNKFVSTTSHTVTGLSANTTYYYRVRAVNSGGPSGYSNIVSVLTAPAAPGSLNATDIGSDAFTATWAGSPGATGYQVEVANNSSFSPVLYTLPTSTTSVGVVGLSGNTTYYYRVRAVNGSLFSGYSNFNSVATLPPAPVNNGPSNITSSSFTANWGTVSGATNYRVLAATDIGFTSLVLDITLGAVTSLNITGLASGTTYYFKVRASNSGWTTGYSSAATALTRPSAPNVNTANTITATSFVASWDASFGATSYWIDVSTSNVFSGYVGTYHDVSVTGTSLSVTGLSSSSVYYYRVRAVNASGESAYSNTVSVLTVPVPPIATAATNVAFSAFVANWGAVAGATGYLLDVSTASNFSTVLTNYNSLPVSGTSQAVFNLSGNTTYYYRVRATNASGPSTNSNSINLLTFPTAPVALASTAITSSTFTANWSAMPGITNFQLFVSSNIDFTTHETGYGPMAVTGTSRVVSGLQQGKTYYYRLRAVNAAGTSAYSNPVEGASFDRNFIKSTIVTKSSVTTPTQINTLGVQERIISYTYFDGLGRPMQNVQMQGSPNQFDVVQPFAYDEYGREKFKYLPYATNEVNGFYKLDPIGTTSYTGSPHNLYYSNGTGDKVQDDTKPYSETVFIPSPLNQVLEQGSTGAAWQPDATHSYTSSDRTVKFSQETNIANEVLLWSFTYPTTTYPFGLVNAGTAAAPIYYGAGQLHVAKSKDENHSEVLEYKDKTGKVILKKVQAPSSQWAQTYYIYDGFGSLVCVLPPEATARLATEYYQAGATDATKDAFLKRWAFRYSYDSKRRMTQKQVPGAEPVYMVYDKRDRLILTQDGNQRSLATKYWTFTKYDEHNRPILTGIKDTTAALTQADMQNRVNTFYTKAWAKLFETYVGAVGGNIHGYSNKSYPVVTTAATIDVNRYLTVTYYDKYDFRSTWSGVYTYVNDALSVTVNTITYNQPTAEHLRTTGQVTGTKVKVLDGGVAGGFTWLKTINYYDDKLRNLQVITENYKGGIDRLSNLYDFAGKVLNTKTTHVESDVTWKDIVGSIQEGNKLYKTVAGAAWGASGAASVQQLAAAQNGWLEVIASETTTPRMVGLSDQNIDVNFGTIDFAFYQATSGALYIYESVNNAGVSRGQFGTYTPGDILKIDRTGTSIKYYRNNVLLYTSQIASSSALIADASFHTLGATLVGVRSSFSTNSRSVSRRFEYDHVGRLTKTWHKLDAGPEILLSLNAYNELGQLVDKKLHSTELTGANAKQSVDYRYNIRGWLSSINNAELAVNSTNDETGDYFGMNLAYHDDLLTGNNTSLQYNGNISATKWSVNQGYGTIKAMAYNYAYDAMNRLTGATHKQATTLGTWVAGQFDENSLTYDLNGNITGLQRRGDGGILIDNLVYNYGSGTTASNKLVYVQDNATDAVAKWKGFYDGNAGTATDYTYDVNGNMITDLNKGISSAIAYNFLNLPEVVSKGGNSIRYIYDAAGRKLSQVTTFGSTVKQTDYAGEFMYENDALQFLNHEEGRIAISTQHVVYTDVCDNTSNKTTSNATLAAVTVNGEKYVRATANGTVVRTGIFPIGGAFPVVAGEKYRIRAKGYRTGANAVHLLIKANSTDLNWPAGSLASSSTTESWTEQIVTIPAGATTLQAGVVWNTVTAGQIFYLNDFSIEKLSTGTPEYQYHLKDHLGNVRVTFTTKDETLNYTATFENNTQTTEQVTFKNYTRVTNDLFDHTDAGTASDKVQLLNGGNNSQVGISKSFAVMPGDVITAQVYAKHYGATGSSGNLAGFASALLTAFGLPTPVAGETGTASAAIQSYGTFIAGGGNPGNPAWTKGFLNILIFDKNYNLVDLAYQQLDAAYVQPVGSSTKMPHQLLSQTKTIKEPGYVYIYVSNEGSVQKDIYFDDMTITHVKSKVIQADDYYPFGLTFNSYQRENSIENKYTYNGKELQDELGLDWLDYGARTYMPELGRFGQMDVFTEIYPSITPYNYVGNNPVLFVDPDGREINVTFQGEDAKKLFMQVVNKILGGQFEVTLTENKGEKGESSGSYKVGLKDASSLGKDKKGRQIKGDESKLSEGARNFYTAFKETVDSETEVNLNIAYGDPNTATGNYNTGVIDIADIAQFPEYDASKSGQPGATQAGKVIHEVREQYSKAISKPFRKSDNVYEDHRAGVNFENSVNRNTRMTDLNAGRGSGVIERFQTQNGTVTQYKITGGPNSPTKGVITVTPVNKK